MAKQVILRRGTTAQHATFTGANGEITVDTVKHVVVVHDGVTAGGIPQANAALVNSQIATLTANAATQATAITVLQANAGTQASTLATLTANAAAQQASINAFILASNATAIFANIAGVQANVTAANAAILLLQGNATVQSEAIALANANIIALQSTVANIAGSNLQAISGHVMPSANVTYDLGSSTRRWRDLYLSGNTINLGGSTIGSTPSGGITVPTVTMGNITFTDLGFEFGQQGSYAFGNVRLTSDGIVIGSDIANPIYLTTANGVPQFYMGGQAIGIDDNGNFVFGTPVAGATETVDDVYQIINIEYKGGGNLALDPNVSISAQVAWLDKLAWRYGIAQDLSPELTALGNPWNVYTPYNGGSPTNPVPVLTNAYENGSLQFVYNEADKVYTYTAAQANIAVGNIMVTTTIVETSPNVYVNSTDPNDWFEVNWAPVFAKGKTAANVNFNSSNVSVWNSIGVSDVPANVTAAIDSLASVIGTQVNLQAISSNIVPTSANVYTLGTPEKPWNHLYVGDITAQGSLVLDNPGRLTFLDASAEALSVGTITSVGNIGFGDSTYQTTAFSNSAVATYLSNFDGSISFTASPAIITGLGNIDSAKVWTGNLEFIDGTYQTTANIMLAAFTMANPTHWTTNVSTIGDALNQLAERIYNIENP